MSGEPPTWIRWMRGDEADRQTLARSHPRVFGREADEHAAADERDAAPASFWDRYAEAAE